MPLKYAVKFENLGKSYMIGHRDDDKQRYMTLTNAMSNAFKGVFDNSINLIKGRPLITGDSFEEFKALKNINLTINEGDRVGIIGKNGAGKSTLLKLLSRITEPTEGRIKIRGRISSLLEVGTGFNSELTGRENIFLNGAIMGMSEREIRSKFDEIVSFSEVEKFIDTPVKRYSSGMYVRLAFAVAAHLESEILVVDEVLAVGDMMFKNKCMGKIQSLGENGRTVIFVSHDMSVVRSLCQSAILLNAGEVQAIGSCDEITDFYEKTSHDPSGNNKPLSIRGNIKKTFFISKVELVDFNSQKPTTFYQAGNMIEIHIWTNQPAPQDAFTIELYILNERGVRVSFAAPNPVCDVYLKKKDTHFVCLLGPLPLTSGRYSIDLIIRVWGQPRWDIWENAISFVVTRCDLFNTGHDVPSGPNGDFIINQKWLTRKD
jgi:lipopolysaccharide transport system ATP-binding protein